MVKTLGGCWRIRMKNHLWVTWQPPTTTRSWGRGSSSLKWKRMRKGLSYCYQVPQLEIQVLPLMPLLNPLIPTPRGEWQATQVAVWFLSLLQISHPAPWIKQKQSTLSWCLCNQQLLYFTPPEWCVFISGWWQECKQWDSPILQMKKWRDELVCPGLFKNKPISALEVFLSLHQGCSYTHQHRVKISLTQSQTLPWRAPS